MLVTFTDTVTPPSSVEEVRSAVFGEASAYFREASNGRTWLSGDVTPWMPIAVSSTGCDRYKIASLAQAAATRAGFKVSGYRRLLYAFPFLGTCGWAGMGRGREPIADVDQRQGLPGDGRPRDGSQLRPVPLASPGVRRHGHGDELLAPRVR
jgi:hypothetical protein